MVWPRSGCATSSATSRRTGSSRSDCPGFRDAACASAEQPGAKDDEGRLHEFRRLQRHPENAHPAPRSLDLDAEEQRHDHQRRRETSRTSARACGSGAGSRNETPIITASAGTQKQRMALDEMIGVETDALRDRRARGKRQNNAETDQDDEGCQEPAVDGPPPLGDCAAVTAIATLCIVLCLAVDISDPSTLLQCHHGINKGFTTFFEVPELVEAGRRRRQQDNRLGRLRRPRIRAAACATAVSSVPEIS
jgi:hypothetical protein